MSFWTAEREAVLRQLKGQKRSASQIARELGTTRNAVIGRWHRMIGTEFSYIQRRRDRRSERAAARAELSRNINNMLDNELAQGTARDIAIARARRAGATYAMIAGHFGFSPQAIHQILARNETTTWKSRESV